MATAIITEQITLMRSPFAADVTSLQLADLPLTQATKPTGAGVFAPTDGESLVPERFVALPFGVAVANVPEQWIRLRFVGWRRALLLGSPDLWIAKPLAEMRCRLSIGMSGFGSDGTAIPSGRVACDRIEVVDGYRIGRTGIEVEDGIPGAPAEAIIALRGCRYVTVQGALEGAAGANLLIGGL